MQFQLIILAFAFSLNAFAVDDKSMQELFKNYAQVMDQKKIELIDEVFTQKFIKDSGGKEELVEKIKELSVPPSQSKITMSWKKGLKNEIYLARLKEKSTDKSKATAKEAEFIVIIESGKPKIDGTMSDEE
jgi:hypothetical protein